MTRYATGAYVDDEHQKTEQLAVGLGWFSIALGVAEISAPGAIARLIGVRDEPRTNSMLRALGARELAHGVGILRGTHRATWVWSRVAGDVVDLACLAGMRSKDTDSRRMGAATAALLGVTAIDVVCAQQLSRQQEEGYASGRFTERRGAGSRRVQGHRFEESTTVNRPIERVYQFWRDFQNLPRFMRHLESVEVLDDRRSRWRATAPAGTTVTWEAEIVDERENELIAWRSIEGSDVRNSGTVRFKRAPGARGTEIQVHLDYQPPAGTLGRGVAWLFGEAPEQQIREDLRRFKQLMETGEIPLSDGPGLWRPARPSSTPEEARKFSGVKI